MADWIETYTGIHFYPLDPQTQLICMKDIAHALSLLCRFTGHCKHFYSVGQHSILTARYMPDEYRLEGLLHDATEAYLNDMARPVKNDITEYRAMEFRLKLKIEERYGLRDIGLLISKKIDNMLLYWEGYYLMPDVSTWNIARPGLSMAEELFRLRSPEAIENQFLDMATIELKKRRLCEKA